ncbi:(2,3-dihydroxybenzoyl)adenylate synthase [Nocardioides humi]|uniref:Long-chain-fatty-acid--CoA ligase n=1 Tax=Nocardioides humi TaxID=449461 RepID=A0ABN2ATR5_9ACTN|nr:AMP-binding protein [Nocardioides humi]
MAAHPEEFAARYRAAGYWIDETFADFVADRTTRFADRTAVVGVDAHGTPVRWTYAELAAAADAAAARLAGAGVVPGDRVVLALPNVVEFVAVVLGCFRAGILPVFAQPGHRETELSQFCAIADAAAIVVSGDTDGHDHRALVDRVAERLRAQGVEPPALVDVQQWPRPGSSEPRIHADPAHPDLGTGRVGVLRRSGCAGSTSSEGLFAPGRAEEVAFLQLSGGTTGVAKLIPRTHADYLYSVRASAEICGLGEETVLLVVLPAAHNFAMSSPGILGVLHVGGTVVLARDPSPRTAFRLVAEERVTWTSLVPPLAQAWISSARRRTPDLSSLEVIQVGGARLSDAVAAEIGPVLGARVQQVFGMAEGLVNYTRLDDPDELVLTTQGRPISPDDEIRIVDPADPDEAEVPDGEEGALQTRGPYTIRGYYAPGGADDPVNRDAFTADGFYRTGDLVRRLPSGHLVVTGRAKDQINRGGEKVATEEIEGPLLARPDVLDAVVVGLPDPYLGERICVVVRPEAGVRSGPDLGAELTEHLRASGLATYKLPDQFEFLDQFPVTHVGKNSRRDLRRLLAARLSDE